MDKPWYQKMFSRPQTAGLETLETRAGNGDAEAQFKLGLKHANSLETARYLQAVQWYRKAADQDHSLAQFNLGMMHAKGHGVSKDDAEAAAWFQKAARQGDAAAQFNLGKSHHRASISGPPADASESRIEAYKWFQLAEAQGYKGLNSAYGTLVLNMTREDVADGRQRAAAFVVEKRKPTLKA